MPREGAKVIYRLSCCFIRVPGGRQVAQLGTGDLGIQGCLSPTAPELGLYFGGASHHWRWMHRCILMALLRVFRARLNPLFLWEKGDKMETNCPNFSRRPCWRTMTPSTTSLSDALGKLLGVDGH